MAYRQGVDIQNTNYLFRDSKSLSHGKLHRQRESYGPTVCLVNSKSSFSPIQEGLQDKTKILMLILEIQRLKSLVSELQISKSIQESRMSDNEVDYLKQQIINLKMALQKSQQQKIVQSQKHNRIINSHVTRISEYQAQINLNHRRLKQAEEDSHDLRRTMRNMEDEVNRVRAQTSRANFTALMSSQADLQKSTIRQKSNEIQRWKDKLSRYQLQIEEQKMSMISQRQAIDQLRNNQLEIKQRYQYDLSNLKTQNDRLKEKITTIQMEQSQQTIHLKQTLQNELRKKNLQFDKNVILNEALVKQNEELSKKNEELSKKNREIQNIYKINDAKARNAVSQLRNQIQQLNKVLNSDREKNEEIKKKNLWLIKQIDSLKYQLINTKNSTASQISMLYQQLEQKQNNLKQIKKKNRKRDHNSHSINGMRINKSLSESRLGNHRLQSSDNDLKEIIADVVELQQSNSRVGKLIDSRVHISGNTSRMVSYSAYGL